MINLQKLNPAERRLLAGFGVVLLFLVHLFGLRLIGQQAHRLSEEADLRQAEKEMVEALVEESAIWAPRQEWLARHLPAKTAKTKKVLDEKMETVGKQFSLNPQRGKTEEEIGDLYEAEHYNAELSGGWSDLVQALQKFYLPEEGIAITSLLIKAVDEKTHSASVTLSRFFLREADGQSP